MKDDAKFDVIIVGGSYAGLSSAMALGRSLRKTLVIDSGSPCNRQTPHSHNFLTQDGSTPEEISGLAREQVAAYGTVSFDDDLVVQAERAAQGFLVTTASGRVYSSAKLIIATGIKDLLPEIPGITACWGISVIHCPYCHGYEFRGQPTGIFANGDRARHLAMLVSNLTDRLTIFTNGDASFSPEDLDRFKKRDIKVIAAPIASIIHHDGHIEAISLQDGSAHPLKALYAAVPFIQHAAFAEAMGCTITEQGHIQVNSRQQTNIPGLYACGDNSSPMRSVAMAVASGNLAGAMANMEFLEELQ